jgi:hypothetical membrane protein
MSVTLRLWFGPLAALLFAAGVIALAMRVPGYSHIHQTVSEIGEVGSPVRAPFTGLLIAVAVCVLVFASGVRAATKAAGRSSVAAWLLVCMAISAAGVGWFSSPHPLHNVFGLSELVGYQAPAALALAWRREPAARSLVGFSWLMFVLIWAAIGLNLVSLVDPKGALWALEKPVYGLVQRSLFAAFFLWLAGAGLMLRPLAARVPVLKTV